MSKYTIDNFGNDILILLSADISDKDKVESVIMFIDLYKHMKKNNEI